MHRSEVNMHLFRHRPIHQPFVLCDAVASRFHSALQLASGQRGSLLPSNSLAAQWWCILTSHDVHTWHWKHVGKILLFFMFSVLFYFIFLKNAIRVYFKNSNKRKWLISTGWYHGFVNGHTRRNKLHGQHLMYDAWTRPSFRLAN